MKYTLIALIAVSLTACMTTEQLTAGKIGCAPQDITISDKKGTIFSKSWVATCKNKRFICSSYNNGNNTSQTDCTAEINE